MNAFTTGTLSACFGTLLVVGLAGAAAPTIRIDASTPAEERLPLQVQAVSATDSVSFLVRIDLDKKDRRLWALRELRELRLVVRDKNKVVLDTLLAERMRVLDLTSGQFSFAGGPVLARFKVDRAWLDRCDLVLTTGIGIEAGPRYVIDLRAYLPGGTR